MEETKGRMQDLEIRGLEEGKKVTGEFATSSHYSGC